MNDNLWFHKKVFLFLVTSSAFGFLITACGPSQAAVDATAAQAAAVSFANQTAHAPTAVPTYTPSPTATLTPAPSPTPTNTPTVTFTPTPWLFAAALRLEDLPAGYRRMSPDELVSLEKNLSDGEIGFGFINDTSSQFIFGILYSYPSRVEQLTFDRMLPEMTSVFSNATGAQETPEPLTGVDNIGDIQEGATFVTKQMGSDMRTELLLFRRDEICAFLFEFYPVGDEPDVAIVAVGQLLDERFSQVLGSRP
jgi:hypothetical protein